jgi:hypothetical protein
VTPTLDQYVQAYLTSMRAPLKQRTVFTQAGRTVVHESGERILYGPKGEKIRVIEHPGHATQIEHGDHLHGIVRPQPVHIRIPVATPTRTGSGAARPKTITTTINAKGPR